MKTTIFIKWKCLAGIFLYMVLTFRVAAQEAAPTTPLPPTTTKPIAVGLSTGASGLFGLDGAISLNRYFNARLGFNYLNYHYSNPAFKPTFIPELAKYQFDLDAHVRMSSINLLGEYKPFKGGAVRIVAGVGIFFQNNLSFSGTANKDYLFNEVIFEPDEIGTATTTWSYKSKISPYLGLAFGRAVPKKRWGFSAEIGSYYKGAPQIDIDATGALRENERNGPILTNNFAHLTRYRFMPSFSLRLAYKIL
jgi:hypothetical protein